MSLLRIFHRPTVPPSARDATARPAAPTSLPETVRLHTDTEGFNRKYDFALDAGRLFYKPHQEASVGGQVEWKPVAGKGLPSEPIREMSVDGSSLAVVFESGRMGFIFNALNRNPDRFRWTERWGAPLGFGAGVSMRKDIVDWAMSYDSPLENRFNIDADGNPQLPYVRTAFGLTNDGRLMFADPWTPNDWGRWVQTPHLRGPGGKRQELVIQSMDVSGSTMVVMDRHGKIFTGQQDYDISAAQNPTVNHRYDPQRRSDAMMWWYFRPRRAVPIPWQHEPKPLDAQGRPAKLTDRVSIHPELNAKGRVVPGSDARIIRVEGLGADPITGSEVAGYWEKKINFANPDEPTVKAAIEGAIRAGDNVLRTDQNPKPERRWTFVPCPEWKASEVRTRLVDTANPDPVVRPSRDASFSGLFSAEPLATGFDAQLLDFNLYRSPTTVRIDLGGDRQIDLRLNLRCPFRNHVVEEPGRNGDVAQMVGVLEIPKAYRNSEDETIRSFIRDVFGRRDYVNVDVQATENRVQVSKRGIDMTFSRDPGQAAVV